MMHLVEDLVVVAGMASPMTATTGWLPEVDLVSGILFNGLRTERTGMMHPVEGLMMVVEVIMVRAA